MIDDKTSVVEVVNTKTGELEEKKAPTPEELLLSAKDAAQALERVIMSNDRPPVMFNGRRHLEYPHWQTIGKFYHVSVRTMDAQVVEIGTVKGFKARAEVIDENTGLIIGGAEAYCMQDEKNWAGKPLYQLASMAQTRAGAKALSNKFRYVAIVAGYEPTPSEEMPEEMRGQKQVAMPKSKPPAETVPTKEHLPASAPTGNSESTGQAGTDTTAPSKFFSQLHKVARLKKINPDNLKWVIKETYKKESSKDLTDSECVALIQLIEAGAIK